MAAVQGEKPVVLITGCSEGGIGYALARAFAARGCLVVATARSASAMASLQGDERFLLREVDVLRDESVRDAVAGALERFGRIDVLVNNAGMHCVAPVAEVPMALVENVFDTNVYGPLRLIQAVVPHMMTRKMGKIVNVGSVTALAPGPWSGPYTASKAALHALTDSLRLELRGFGIEVINVVPGAIRSNLGGASTSLYNHMPEWKFYKKFESAIRSRTDFSQGPKSTPAEEFARKTVDIVLKRKSPAYFSYGHLSTLFAIFYHLPISFRDFLFGRAFKC